VIASRKHHGVTLLSRRHEVAPTEGSGLIRGGEWAHSGIAVRLATVEDAPSIADVLRKAFVEYKPLYTPDAYAATTLSADRIRKRWSEGPVWVASDDGSIVGTVAVVRIQDEVYVRSLAVLPDARRRGIAALMLQEVAHFAVVEGARKLVLDITPFLRRAIRLYEKCGFRWTGDGPHSLHGTPIFTMTKELRWDPPGR
jgi:ribosomal protein S18 acetylase RimI-like enzyme